MERVPNAEQRQVIEDLENNLIVFASAGTGKTFTVAKRVENIIRLQRALPEQILCLTFTAKACGEMRDALVRYVGEQAKKVEIRTIHGFCYRLMQEESRLSGGNYSEATVCDEEDEEDLLLSILSSQFYFWENGVLPKENEDGEGLTNTAFRIYEKRGGLRTFITALKHAREELRLYTENEEEDYQKSFEFLRARRQKIYEEILSYRTRSGVQVRDESFERGMTKFAGKFASAYENHLRQSNRVDYDDLIVFANRRLRDEEAGKRWANRYAYIVVDEMQDTSLTEYSVLKGLFGKNRVMMCGDFFQSIYGWRGANPQFVLQDFIENYHAKAYAFSENYRSTQTLANATFEYLKESYPQSMGKYFPKNLRVNNGETGEKILCCGFDNRQEEARQIYEYIKKKGWQNGGNMCVMARSNGYIKALAQSFEDINAAYPIEERISFYTAEEHLNFYKKPVVKDVLAIFRLLLNGTDRLSAERIARKYVRLVGEKTIEQLRLQNALGVSIVSFLERRTKESFDPYFLLTESFSKGEIVVYDTETTGLDLGRDEIVQISAIRLDKEGKVVAVFDQMVVPEVEISKPAYETHGFDLEYIQTHGGVTAKEALTRFSEFVKGGVLVGHNSFRFDAPLIRRQLKENGLPTLDIQGEYDTLVISKQFLQGLENYKLSTLCERYGIVNEAAHNAYGDIVATGKVLCKLIEKEILPTAMERINVCEKLAPKFKKFYGFLEEMREKLARGELVGMLEEISARLSLKTRYNTHADGKALQDLSLILRSAKAGEEEVFLRGLLADADLTGSRSEKLFAGQNRIPILTVHQAKGLEFCVVILAGVDDLNFPNQFAVGEEGLDEERKVFYVAITRAKERLILTRASYNGRGKILPSRFVDKIPERFLYKNRGWEGLDE